MKSIQLNKILFVAFVILSACKSQQDVSPADVKTWVYEIMKENYLWNDQLPEIDPLASTTPEELVDVLKVPEDRFTFITNRGQALVEQLSVGRGTTLGFGYRFDRNGNLRVTFVYANSPAARVGMERGAIITRINTDSTLNPEDVTIDPSRPYTFRFINLQGDTINTNIAPATITLNTVLYGHVDTLINNKIVGYLVFSNFFTSSAKELDSTFASFKSLGVNELILDLRYNGGGSVNVARQLASLIAPSRAINQPFVQQVFNENNREFNSTLTFQANPNGLNLKQLVVITTGNTASASELIINSLRPFMPVKIVGGKTAGKNVGSVIFQFENYGFLPIVFRSANAEGFSDYGEGFMPDRMANDNVSKPFGDPAEDSYAAALYYIQNGVFPPQRPSNNSLKTYPLIRLDGIPTVIPMISDVKLPQTP